MLEGNDRDSFVIKDTLNLNEIGTIIGSAKELAKRYRRATGRPLGITGEVAEYEAARLLGLDLAVARNSGYDAVDKRNGETKLIQIKGRCVLSCNPGQRVGSIDTNKEWDSVLLVLLNADLEPTVIYEANRHEIIEALLKPGSKARNECGQLSVSKFKSLGKIVWHVK